MKIIKKTKKKGPDSKDLTVLLAQSLDDDDNKGGEEASGKKKNVL